MGFGIQFVIVLLVAFHASCNEIGKIIHDDGSVTVFERNNWEENLGGSILLTIVGGICFFCSFMCLISNERKMIKTKKYIEFGYSICKEISADTVENENNDKLVCFSGYSAALDKIKDSEFNLEFTRTLKVVRKVEIYQMQESSSSHTTKDKVGGGSTTETKYTYSEVWSESLIDSSHFQNQSYRHLNPKTKSFESKTFNCDRVQVGCFYLDNSQISQIKANESLTLENFDIKTLPDPLSSMGLNGKLKIKDNKFFYISEHHRDYPEIGDTRISFTFSKEKDLTLVAKQMRTLLAPFNIKKLYNELEKPLDFNELGKIRFFSKLWNIFFKAPNEINWVFEGKLNKRKAFQEKVNENISSTWLYRFLGWLLMFIGSFLSWSLMIELFGFLPFIPTIVKVVGFYSCLIFSTFATMLTVASAWLYYRTSSGIILLGIVLGAGYVVNNHYL